MGMHERRLRLPPLDLLTAFEAAARLLSFTRAGDELALTQSAVSRRIQALEESLGTRLFERRTRALLLTREGHLLARAVEQAFAVLAEATRTLRGASEVRTVTLTTTPGFASLWLIPRLSRFLDACPGVDVRTSASNQRVDLARAGVDLAVRFATARDCPDGRRLFGGQVTLVCSPRLTDGPAKLASPADLAHFTLLYLDDPNAAWFDWNLWFHALGLADFEPARRLHYSHYDQMIQAAVNGQGVALGLDPLVRELLRGGQLVAPFPRAEVPARAWYLMRAPHDGDRPEVDAFVAWLLAEVASESRAMRPSAGRSARAAR